VEGRSENEVVAGRCWPTDSVDIDGARSAKEGFDDAALLLLVIHGLEAEAPQLIAVGWL
jgi:hypothetical protein